MPNRLPAATGLPGAAGVLRGASTPHPRPKSPSRCFRRRQMETQPPKPSAPGPRRGGGKRRAGQVPPGAEQGLPGPGEGDRRHVSTSGAARLRGAHAQSAPISAGGGGRYFPACPLPSGARRGFVPPLLGDGGSRLRRE